MRIPHGPPFDAPVAQRPERLPSKQVAAGGNPAWRSTGDRCPSGRVGLQNRPGRCESGIPCQFTEAKLI